MLSDEPFRSQYGSVQHQQRAVNQPDPEVLRREREAMETICHAMSEWVTLTLIYELANGILDSDVVDIFSALPHPVTQGKEASALALPKCLQINRSEITRSCLSADKRLATRPYRFSIEDLQEYQEKQGRPHFSSIEHGQV